MKLEHDHLTLLSEIRAIVLPLAAAIGDLRERVEQLERAAEGGREDHTRQRPKGTAT